MEDRSDARPAVAMFGARRDCGGYHPWRSRRNQSICPRDDRAAAAAQPDPAMLAGRHRWLDLRRRAADRRIFDGVGTGAALDRRDDGRDVRFWGDRQCLDLPGPAFWLDGPERGDRAGGGRVLDSSLRDVKQDDSNNEVAPSRGGEKMDDV